MSAGTEVSTPASTYLALSAPASEVTEVIEANLGGQSVSEFDLMKINVPSGRATTYRWEVETLEGSESVDTVSGIIVYRKDTRAFWPMSLEDGGGNTPPSCSSPDAHVGFGKQWATKEDPDPDGEPRKLECAACPHSQFGSDGGRGQACKQTTQLFLLMEHGFLPAVVAAPPTSLQAIKRYMLKLAGAGVRYDTVVTTLGLEKATNPGGIDYAKIVPKLGARLDPETAAKARGYSELLKPILASARTEPVPPVDENGEVI